MENFDRNASQFLSEPVSEGLALGVVPMLCQRRPFFDTVLKDHLSLLRRICLAVRPATGLVILTDPILDNDAAKRVDFRLEDGATGPAENEELDVVAAGPFQGTRSRTKADIGRLRLAFRSSDDGMKRPDDRRQ